MKVGTVKNYLTGIDQLTRNESDFLEAKFMKLAHIFNPSNP